MDYSRPSRHEADSGDPLLGQVQTHVSEQLKCTAYNSGNNRCHQEPQRRQQQYRQQPQLTRSPQQSLDVTEGDYEVYESSEMIGPLVEPYSELTELPYADQFVHQQQQHTSVVDEQQHQQQQHISVVDEQQQRHQEYNFYHENIRQKQLGPSALIEPRQNVVNEECAVDGHLMTIDRDNVEISSSMESSRLPRIQDGPQRPPGAPSLYYAGNGI